MSVSRSSRSGSGIEVGGGGEEVGGAKAGTKGNWTSSFTGKDSHWCLEFCYFFTGKDSHWCLEFGDEV